MFRNIFITFGVLEIFLSVAFSETSVAQKNTPEDQKAHVNIFDSSGKLMGDLRESDEGKNLVLSRVDGEKIPCASWEDEFKQKTLSPRGLYKVVVRVRNCGATTDFSTSIDLVSIGEKGEENDPNTIFVIKGDQSVKAQWSNPQKLLIQYPQMKKESIYLQKTRFKGISIDYRKTTDSEKKSQYLELGNFNYGLTGVAVGHTQETLLRIAGWAQEKSGLFRKEWGHWYADTPYGDDPEGQKYIKQGFEYYKLHRDEIKKKTKANRF